MPGGTVEERFQNDRTPEAEISPTHPRPSRDVLAALRQNLLVAGSYWALAALVKWFFSRYQMWPAPLWLPAGVALFAALALPRRSWLGIFFGSFVTNIFSFNEPAAWAAVTALGNTIAPVVVAGLFRRGILTRELFYRTSNAIFMILATLLDGAIGAAFGVTVVWAQSSAGLHTLPSRWLAWTLSDAAASLLLTPLLLLWQQRRRSSPVVYARRTEFWISGAVSLLAVVYLLFGTTGVRAADAGASFLILLPLLWMAVRMSLRVVYPMFVIVMGAVIIGTMEGHGPFFGTGVGGAFIIFAQMAIGFGSSVLLLGGASAEQRLARDALQKLNLDLEARVERRTAELLASQRQLERAAFYDVLTGLPNRRLLEERFASCGVTARRKGDRFALLLIDLDHFKEINDNFGHDAGDSLLVITASRLKAAVRDSDVVGRMGGDEFMVLLPEAGDKAAIEVVCHRILESLGTTMVFKAWTLRTSPSIGVARFPDDGATWQSVYKAADLALYEAKRAGRNTWRGN